MSLQAAAHVLRMSLPAGLSRGPRRRAQYESGVHLNQLEQVHATVQLTSANGGANTYREDELRLHELVHVVQASH